MKRLHFLSLAAGAAGHAVYGQSNGAGSANIPVVHGPDDRNILVTKDGTPKLLDFGIAKILDPSGDSEITMPRPMTPEYASPEQVRGEPITTASDVYSLGVVLYQLLTGRSPYRISNKSHAQLSQAITGTDPQRLSTAVKSPALQEQIATPGSGAHAILSEREPTPVRVHSVSLSTSTAFSSWPYGTRPSAAMDSSSSSPKTSTATSTDCPSARPGVLGATPPASSLPVTVPVLPLPPW